MDTYVIIGKAHDIKMHHEVMHNYYCYYRYQLSAGGHRWSTTGQR